MKFKMFHSMKKWLIACISRIKWICILQGLMHLIDDHYPKYVLTLDDVPSQCYDGIWQYNVIEWLLEK